jgi:AraC family transcriptional activator of tynA and feaB
MITSHFSSAQSGDKSYQWKKLIDELFGSADISISNESKFFGGIQRSSIGGIELVEVASNYEDAKRTKSHIAKDKKERFVFVLVRAGTLEVVQFDRECVLSPGSFVLIDLNSPYTFRHFEQINVLDLTIPSIMLRSRLSDPYRLVATRHSATSGIGRVTADFLTSLSEEISRIPDEASETYSREIVDLISLLFECSKNDLPISNSSARSAIYRRCVALIDNNLADPELDPMKIAQRIGISVRYLHKIFQDSDESVCELLRNRRLERCRKNLVDPRQTNLPISEIAFRAGFQSQSHFTNRFKSRFHLAPGELRRSITRS